MATKKVGKAAALATRKSAVSAIRRKPEYGDVVWVERLGVLGLFEWYLPSSKTLKLDWTTKHIPIIWPNRGHEFSPVEKQEIRILYPYEILEKVELLMQLRDEKMKKAFAVAVADRSPEILAITF